MTESQQLLRYKKWNDNYGRCKLLVSLVGGMQNLRFKSTGWRYFHALKKLKRDGRTTICGALPEIGRAHKLTRENYYLTLKACLLMEEAQQFVEMRQFDMINEQISIQSETLSDGGMVCKIRLPGISEGQPPVVAGDLVLLVAKSCRVLKVITEVTANDQIVIKAREDWPPNDDKFSVFLIPSGSSFQTCNEALNYYNKDNKRISQVLFGPEGGKAKRKNKRAAINVAETNTSELMDRLERFNDLQRRAIVGILEAKCRPYPYIVFGPPGSGKTLTLVEAIAQIHYRSAKNVLVCAKSNHCAYHIATKLKEAGLSLTLVFNQQDGFQVNAGDVSDTLNPNLKLSNGDKAESCKRIVVTTIMTSSRLYEDQFDYVFIDEANHINEPEALVPTCLLALDGCLVLAGDTRQLGPVVRLKEAQNILGVSIIERMMKDLNVYKKTQHYNRDYLTKLVISYRCDLSIMGPTNRLFYGAPVHCINKTPPSLLRMLKLTGPLVFMNTPGHVYGALKHNTICNQQEAESCSDLLVLLLMIGLEVSVITPYKSQANLINHKCVHKLAKAKHLFKCFESDEERKARIAKEIQSYRVKHVGLDSKLMDEAVATIMNGARKMKPVRLRFRIDTVDSFQGDESEAVIISTVSHFDAGYDWRQVNVAWSRAKWLLFVLGNELVLKHGRSKNQWCSLLASAINWNLSDELKRELHRKAHDAAGIRPEKSVDSHSPSVGQHNANGQPKTPCQAWRILFEWLLRPIINFVRG